MKLPGRRTSLARQLPMIFSLMLALTMIGSASPGAQAAAAVRPNIVIIMSDDQRWDTMTARYMPNLTDLVAPNGVRLDSSFVSNPLCCPSRVTTLTERYSTRRASLGTWAPGEASVRRSSIGR
jgi:arylsulfatase A-like enzyme